MMPSILATKLYIPPARPTLVPRPHLIERLDEALRLRHRVTLISASAGSGKTTLLSEWAAKIQRPVAWLSLDEDDNDPLQFWMYLVAALQQAYPQIGQSEMALLQGSQPLHFQAFLSPLINEITALGQPTLLILDDYHLITAQAIHEGVSFFIEHQPPQLHLVLATRADPPLPVVRLRARGQLTELRADDLRFTAEEVTTFLSGVMKLDLQPEDIAALGARTEGWISGLHLAALSLQGSQDAHAFVEAFTGGHHYILEYLIEEVLDLQPEAVQRFLLQTSILERLSAPLCDALMGEQDSSDILDHLLRDNLFLVPLDNERRWYRYHHLFGDLLRKRLGQSTSPEQISELHRRAGQWHEENDLLEQAVKHARAAGDFERIAEIAERAAGDSLLDARLTTLLRWVNELPKEVLHTHPRLQIYRAWALFMNGHLEPAQQALGDCRQSLETLPPSPENDAQRYILTRLLDTIDMIARGFMYIVDNKIEEATQVCSQARGIALEDGHVFLAVQAIEGLALAKYYQGRLRESAQTCQQVIDLATQSAAQSPLAAAGYVELAGVHTEWNDLDTAADLLDKALVLCHQWGIIQTLNEAYTAQSRLLQARGDIEGAQEALEKARQFSSIEGDRSMVNFRLAAQQACLNLQVGKLDDVIRWVEGTKVVFAVGRDRVRLPIAFLKTIETILARTYLAQNKAEEALSVLEPLIEPAKAAEAYLYVIEVCALKALTLQALGDTSAALAALKCSLALAEPEGYVRMFINEGPPMARLLQQATSPGIHTEYAHKLLAAFEAGEHQNMEETPIQPDSYTATLKDPLTPRELEVLQFISQGFSNQQVSDELVIALNTVKRHTSSIYSKLGVKSRTQAIARARELGLISLTS